jgi:hypothetical protein
MRSLSDNGASAPILHSPTYSVLARFELNRAMNSSLNFSARSLTSMRRNIRSLRIARSVERQRRVRVAVAKSGDRHADAAHQALAMLRRAERTDAARL